MRQSLHTLSIQTRGRGLVEVTREIAAWVGTQDVDIGLLTVFCRHTSASLLIQENADPDVRGDIEAYFERLAPEERGRYAHEDEGPDDMPAHLRAALTTVQLTIPVSSSRMTLGTWQGVYLFEHRRAPHRREIVLHLIGD
ncbi:MAG TPA: secondary thiamine-phosphate synthase enzyme YjbQ [Caulobacteraceae bacterium]|jgi:secondary thiamine-phosphate synthase enzyme|nr:secondary thiamine-phosphate synthase enzyme YjbQ [Caulobacteraceae bacterium]